MAPSSIELSSSISQTCPTLDCFPEAFKDQTHPESLWYLTYTRSPAWPLQHLQSHVIKIPGLGSLQNTSCTPTCLSPLHTHTHFCPFDHLAQQHSLAVVRQRPGNFSSLSQPPPPPQASTSAPVLSPLRNATVQKGWGGGR